jgi:hypothetical protein
VLRILLPWGAPVRCSGRRSRRVVPQGKAGHRSNAWVDHPSPDGSRERAAWAEGTASMDLSFLEGLTESRLRWVESGVRTGRGRGENGITAILNMLLWQLGGCFICCLLAMYIFARSWCCSMFWWICVCCSAKMEICVAAQSLSLDERVANGIFLLKNRCHVFFWAIFF